MGPATLIPNTVSRTWQSATFSLFSLLSIYVFANHLFSFQSHCFITSFSRCFLSPLLFHTSSFIKGALFNRNPTPHPSFLWALTLFFPDLVDSPAIPPALLSLLWRKLKGKNFKTWVLVLIHYPLRSFIYTLVFRPPLHSSSPRNTGYFQELSKY